MYRCCFSGPVVSAVFYGSDHKRTCCADRLHFCDLKWRHRRLLPEFQKRNGKSSHRSEKWCETDHSLWPERPGTADRAGRQGDPWWGWGCGHRTGRGKKSSYGSGRLKTGMPGDICGRIFSQRVCDRFTFHWLLWGRKDPGGKGGWKGSFRWKDLSVYPGNGLQWSTGCLWRGLLCFKW